MLLQVKDGYYQQPFQQAPPEEKGKGYGIASLALCLILSFAGLIFGIVGLSYSKANRGTQTRRLSTIGVVLSSVFLFIKVILLVLIVIAFFSNINDEKNREARLAKAEAVVMKYSKAWIADDAETMASCYYDSNLISTAENNLGDDDYIYSEPELYLLSETYTSHQEWYEYKVRLPYKESEDEDARGGYREEKLLVEVDNNGKYYIVGTADFSKDIKDPE